MNEIVLKEKMSFEKFKEDLELIGFQVDNDIFRIEKDVEDTSVTQIINGVRIPQIKHVVFQMRYLGEGGVLDDGSEEEISQPLYFFELLEDDGHATLELGFTGIDDFNKTIRL